MCTAANFIIEGRIRPYGRSLCTVALGYFNFGDLLKSVRVASTYDVMCWVYATMF